MPYKHGIYGIQVPTTDQLPPSGVMTLPVYIGTAPIQQVADLTEAINKPILITSFEEAKQKIGYSDDWETFTLCEAVYAHFKNRIAPMGPIVVINVMDPATDVDEATMSVQITNGIGYINAPAVLDSITIATKTQGVDYTAEYVGEKVKLTALPGKTLSNPTSATFDVMDITTVDSAQIIGGIDAGVRTGISAIEMIYQSFNMIPTIIAAPGWSHIKVIKEAMIEKSNKINGHWDALVVADIGSDLVTTLVGAIDWKEDNGYVDSRLKVGWPKAESYGKTFFASTLISLRMQQTDFISGNAPYVSPSNKKLDITGPVLFDGTEIFFDEVEANKLNEHGITTYNFASGSWVLWGPHCANYEFGTEMDPKEVFDASIRMMMYLTNSFQNRYINSIDGPLTRSTVDTILNDSQTWLNGMIADGQLLYGGIYFNETSNPTSSIVEGDFVFDIKGTMTPVAKSMTFVVQYTTKGIENLFGGAN